MTIRRMSLVAGMLATVLLGGCTLTAEREVITENDSQMVIKSPADDRDYRFVEMDNGLRVLLISDPDTDKAAAAVDVNVGSWNDPDNRLGLAHFLEHMLFLGNKKYPEVDGYFEFIRANGGGANAYTANTRTNYFFDINSDKLRTALDQLAQFFVAPTLDPAYVDRERNAVDSEYKLHAKEDGWRLLTAQNVTSNPGHPKSRFNIGNLDTLSNADGKSLWKDLKAFYDEYYVASNMGVVVYGWEPVDTLERWVKESFRGVPEGKAVQTASGLSPYTPEQLGVRVNLEPLKDTRILSLSFPLPSQYKAYRKKPLGYLARIVGYEGENSLHSYLKDRGLIESLAAYSNDVPNEYSEFTIRMELTPAGLEKVDDITAVVFDYLALVREEGLKPWIYEESRQIADLGFRFQEDANPQQTASGLASRLHDIPAEDVLRANYLYEEFDEALIRELMSAMVADNLRQVIIAQNLKTDKVEPYFDTRYSIQPLTDDLKKRLGQVEQHPELAVPAPNAFIARDLEMRQGGQSDEPQLVVEKEGLSVWSMTDSSFAVPRANIRIKISTDRASKSAEDAVALQLYRTLLSRSLNAYGYPAKEAGLNYGLSTGREGLVIALSGYQDKQGLLLQDILKGIKTFNPAEAEFKQEKDAFIRRIRNKEFQAPYRLGMDRMSQQLYPRYWDDQALLSAAEAMTLKDVEAYANDFYDAIHIDMLVHGNFSPEETRELSLLLERNLLTDSNAAPRFRQPFNLIEGKELETQADFNHNDSVYISYFQRPGIDNRDRASYSLLGRLLATPFFNQLRTEQQLGYIVFAGARPMEKHPGLIFVVQSPVLGPDGISERVDTFLNEQVKRINSLTDEELAEYRRGLIGDLLKKDSNLDERSARFWQVLESDEESFDFQKKIADEVETITVKDIQQAMAQLMNEKGRLTVLAKGQHADSVAK